MCYFEIECRLRISQIRLCAAGVSLLLRRIGRWSGREIARSARSLARSAQAERDNESWFFVRAAGVHRFIRRYHVKMLEVEELKGKISHRTPKLWATRSRSIGFADVVVYGPLTFEPLKLEN
ncbi:hypothetical protein EVAR_90082_1 [Eumeta japonica]|uniref:Uncharacterized protein n=1 Tax=Eumeta variegata TaxID=151549 RepID=A0A4C1WYH1_EUMVA|nr:hypothetical protein EVAR_90082_1 [Eumeta japonica]